MKKKTILNGSEIMNGSDKSLQSFINDQIEEENRTKELQRKLRELDKEENPNFDFVNSRTWFDEQYKNLELPNLQLDFLKHEIARTKKALNDYLQNLRILSPAKIEEFKGCGMFLTYLENLSDKSLTSEKSNTGNVPLIKIKWSGQKNQLYDVLRILKEEKKLIENSYPDLAVFLKQTFEGFENTALSTIQTELQRDKRPPKGKRVNLDTFDSEGK